MKRIHIMLRVKDLEKSLGFYTALFDAEPTVRKPEYAKWMLEDPRINFSIATHADGHGIEHLGIQAESAEELDALRRAVARASTADGAVDHEGETTCCYARSDKTWITDAQGVSWEMFYTHGMSDTYRAPADETRASGCCAPTCCSPAEAEAAGACAC